MVTLAETLRTYEVPLVVLWLAALGYVAWVHGFMHAVEGCRPRRPKSDRDERAWPSERGLR